MGFLKDVITVSLKYLYTLTDSYGWSIILLTVIIRLLLYPVMANSAKSMVVMRRIQPKMKELQDKYKDNPEEMNRRMMELYKTEKFNPFGGCLPMLVQMVILFALFYALRDFNFGGAGFLWMPNLGQKDPLYIIPVLAGVTQYLIQKMTPTDPSQAVMMAAFPFLMVFIVAGLPAGLGIYWITANFFQIGQQYVTNKKFGVYDEGPQESSKDKNKKKSKEGKGVRNK